MVRLKNYQPDDMNRTAADVPCYGDEMKEEDDRERLEAANEVTC